MNLGGIDMLHVSNWGTKTVHEDKLDIFSDEWLNDCLMKEMRNYFLSEHDFDMFRMRYCHYGIDSRSVSGERALGTLCEFEVRAVEGLDRDKIISLIPEKLQNEIEECGISAEEFIFRKFVQTVVAVGKISVGNVDSFNEYILYRMCKNSDMKRFSIRGMNKFLLDITDIIYKQQIENNGIYGVNDIEAYVNWVKEYYTNAHTIVSVREKMEREIGEVQPFNCLLSNSLYWVFDELGFVEGIKYLQWSDFKFGVNLVRDYSKLFSNVQIMVPKNIVKIIEVFLTDKEKVYKIIEKRTLPYEVLDKCNTVKELNWFMYEQDMKELFEY